MSTKIENVSKLYSLIQSSYFETSVFEITRVNCIILTCFLPVDLSIHLFHLDESTCSFRGSGEYIFSFTVFCIENHVSKQCRPL